MSTTYVDFGECNEETWDKCVDLLVANHLKRENESWSLDSLIRSQNTRTLYIVNSDESIFFKSIHGAATYHPHKIRSLEDLELLLFEILIRGDLG